MVSISNHFSVSKTKSEYEKQFNNIVKHYDMKYDKRFENLETQDILRVYELENSQTGYIVASQGYKDIILMFVVLNRKEVKEVKILYHNETRDYGGYVEKEWFLNRLLVSSSSKLQTVIMKKENPNDIVAITGATITTDAVVNGINKCIEKDGRK